MNENENKEVIWLYCPMIKDIVQAKILCEMCTYWSGIKCYFPILKSFRKIRRPKYRVKKSRSRKGGRGVKLPPVWEKWPESQNLDNMTDKAQHNSEESEYGVTGLLAENENSATEHPEEEIPAYVDSKQMETKPVEPEIEVKKDVNELQQRPELEPAPEFSPNNPQFEPFPNLSDTNFGEQTTLDKNPAEPDIDKPLGLPEL